MNLMETLEEKRKKKPRGLWHNIHQRRKKGLPRKNPGQKGYPKTLDIESVIREFISEAIKSVQKATVGTFDLNYFKGLSRLHSMMDYAMNRLQMVGYGSSRVVFILTGKTVLKIARSEGKGTAQNEAEVLLSEAGDTGDAIMKVKGYDPSFKWVISEIAKPVSEGEFESITKTPWPEHVAWIYGVLMTGLRDEDAILEKLTSSQLSTVEKKLRGIVATGVGADQEIVRIFNNRMSPFTKTFVLSLLNSGAFSPDLTKIDSYGKTSSGKICVLDYGYTEWNRSVVLDKK